MSMGYIAVAAAIVGSAVYTGEETRKANRQSLLAQTQRQRSADDATIKTSTLAEMEKKKANKKRSDAQQYMAKAAMASQQGPASTLMGGAGGGRSLLGGPGTLIT